jgi:hypothetical protein
MSLILASKGTKVSPAYATWAKKPRRPVPFDDGLLSSAIEKPKSFSIKIEIIKQ